MDLRAVPSPMCHLREAAARASFETAGHTIVGSLEPSEVTRLRDAALRRLDRDGPALSIDYTDPDRRSMADTSAVVATTWTAHLSRFFEGMRPVFASFVVKRPRSESSMFLHDDRCFVHPDDGSALVAWVPLVNVGPEIPNGGLMLLPGSERIVSPLSGTGTPSPYRHYERHLLQRLTTPQLSAGTVMVYDPRLLHGSDNNRSEHPRPALVVVLAPRDSRLVHIVATGSRRRLIYEVDESFYLDHPPDDLERSVPGRNLIEVVDEDVGLDREVVAELLGTSAAPPIEPVVPTDMRNAHDAVQPGEGTPLPQEDMPAPAADLRVDGDVSSVPPTAEHAPDGRWRTRTLAGSATIASGEAARAASEQLGVDSQHVWSGTRLVALDEGARYEVRREVTGPLELAVLVATPTRAGAIADRTALALEAGYAHMVDPELLLIWNDGPGPLVLRVTEPRHTGSGSSEPTH